jgi:hypothetical protein
MGYTGKRHVGVIDEGSGGHDLDCALMTEGHLNAK